MSLPVVVLAGGLATRLGPLTRRVPKSLVEVAGKPFAVHQIELLRQSGIAEITFLVGHLGEMIADVLGDGARWGVQLRYVFDGSRALGTGGAIRHAAAGLADSFFVLYGDAYLDCDYAGVERAFHESGKSGLMTVYRNENRFDVSNVLYVDGRIVRYHKRRRTPDMRHIDYGLGVFRKSAFARRAHDDTFDLEDIYRDLLRHGDLAAFEVTRRFYEIGSPAGLEETRAHLTEREAPPDERPQLTGWIPTSSRPTSAAGARRAGARRSPEKPPRAGSSSRD
jgi:NDP-sugar pyrophosphorylase family protein